MNSWHSVLATRPFCVFLICLGPCLVVMAGCGESRRQGVKGVVTLDGEPLDRGDITFFPLGNTEGPAAGTRIVDGRFEVAADKGTFEGQFRVEIARYDTIPGKFMPGKEGRISVQGNVLPARYNTKSELTADIKAGETNQLQFDLTSN